MVELMEKITTMALLAEDVLEDDMSEPNWAEMTAPSVSGSPLRLVASQSMQHLNADHQMRLAA